MSAFIRPKFPKSSSLGGDSNLSNGSGVGESVRRIREFEIEYDEAFLRKRIAGRNIPSLGLLPFAGRGDISPIILD